MPENAREKLIHYGGIQAVALPFSSNEYTVVPSVSYGSRYIVGQFAIDSSWNVGVLHSYGKPFPTKLNELKHIYVAVPKWQYIMFVPLAFVELGIGLGGSFVYAYTSKNAISNHFLGPTVDMSLGLYVNNTLTKSSLQLSISEPFSYTDGEKKYSPPILSLAFNIGF